MKNPATTALAIIAGAGIVVGIVLISASASGVFKTYDYAANGLVNTLPIWVGIIPAAIGAVASVAALMLWGQRNER